jgi:ankyrin repeat protein
MAYIAYSVSQCRAQTKMSALFVAAQAGHYDVVTTLLDAKADINSPRSVGLPPFLFAVYVCGLFTNSDFAWLWWCCCVYVRA